MNDHAIQTDNHTPVQETIFQARTKPEIKLGGPSVGAMQIDDKDITALRYDKTEKNGAATYNVTFMMDNKTVVKLKGLNQTELENAVGNKNSETILKSETEKGTLRGSTLANEYGLSPEENARRIAAKDSQREVPANHDLEADDPAEQNVVSHDHEHEPEKLQEIDIEEALARLARHRAAERRMEERLAVEREQRQRKEQNKRVDNAEDQKITVENPSEKASEQDNTHRIKTDHEKNRQLELIDQVHSQFHVAGSKFHFKDQSQRIAFKDKGKRMVSASNDDRVAHAMATMAEAKGWKNIRVSGHPDFKKEVWLEANLRGLKVRGYAPKERDLQELEDRFDKRSRNTIEYEPKKEQKKTHQKAKEAHKEERQPASTEALKTELPVYTGRLIEQGEIRQPFTGSKNYYVRLSTDNGEKTAWGKDLKRAMAESKAIPGDQVRLEFQGKKPVTVEVRERDKAGNFTRMRKTKKMRDTWEAQKSDRAKVVGAVAKEMMKSKGLTEEEQKIIMNAINQRLEQREKQGKVPTVPIYDKKAPSAQIQAERKKPQVERNAERTR